jgi:GWxTD domain-containing protein
LERREAAGLKTDAEWERFIEQFWRRRNPNPEKRENLLKEEHYRRISYANQRYGEASTPGWRTERGRLYISYGPPDEITVLGGYEKWFYRRLAGVGNNVSFEFGLDRKPSESQAQQEAMRYLEQLLRQSEQIDRAAQERTKALQNVELQKRDLERVQEEIQRVQAELARLKAEQAAKQR